MDEHPYTQKGSQITPEDFGPFTLSKGKPKPRKAVAIIKEHICPHLRQGPEAEKVHNIIAEFRK